MTLAEKKRKQKTRGSILQDADISIQGNMDGPYYWGEHIYRILVNVWTTAFQRGYRKALRDMFYETSGNMWGE
jgi:hypothetical protein